VDYKQEGKEIIEGIIIAVVLYLVISLTLSYALKVEDPVAVVISGSMEPVYYRGDIIVIKGTNQAIYRWETSLYTKDPIRIFL